MDSILPILAGIALGFAVVFLFRLGQGKLANCVKCGQQHWISRKNIGTAVCKKCGGPLGIQKKDNKADSRTEKKKKNK